MVTKVGGDISEYLPGSDSDDYLYGLGAQASPHFCAWEVVIAHPW
jgi:hypothetical protein